MSKQFQTMSDQIHIMREVGSRMYEVVPNSKGPTMEDKLIDCLTTYEKPVGINELARAVGYPYSTTRRAMFKLCAMGLVARRGVAWLTKEKTEKFDNLFSPTPPKPPRWTTQATVIARIKELQLEPIRTKVTSFALNYKKGRPYLTTRRCRAIEGK